MNTVIPAIFLTQAKEELRGPYKSAVSHLVQHHTIKQRDFIHVRCLAWVLGSLAETSQYARRLNIC